MKKKAPKLFCLDQPKSANAGLFRTIRTNLRYTRVGGNIKSLLVTSSLPEEGKSTMAINIAIAFAETGKSVLLLDGDLRTPSVHETFELQNQVGLTSILVEQTALAECVYQINEVPGLYVLPSGPVSPNPAELLGSDGMKVLFAELGRRWDMIVIDASSVLMPFSDALVLAGLTEGVLLVIQSGKVLHKHALTAKQLLEQHGGHILGAVLNQHKGSKRSKIRSEDLMNFGSTTSQGNAPSNYMPTGLG